MGDKSFGDILASAKIYINGNSYEVAKGLPELTIGIEKYESEFKNKSMAFVDECLYNELKRQSKILNSGVNATPELIRVFLDTAEKFINLHSAYGSRGY